MRLQKHYQQHACQVILPLDVAWRRVTHGPNEQHTSQTLLDLRTSEDRNPWLGAMQVLVDLLKVFQLPFVSVVILLPVDKRDVLEILLPFLHLHFWPSWESNWEMPKQDLPNFGSEVAWKSMPGKLSKLAQLNLSTI
jgi:hypothetical protein